MLVVPDGEAPVVHEVGHAAAHMFFGHGVDHISIRPDGDGYSGATVPRTDPNDMSRYQRVVCFLAGPRAEQVELTQDLERRTDLQTARAIVSEMVGAAGEHEPEVDELIHQAWADAGDVLERTRRFRDCAEREVYSAGPFAKKTHVGVEQCWDDNDEIGHRVVFTGSDKMPRQHLASARVNGEEIGSISFGVDEGTDGVERLELINAEVSEPFRKRGHAKRVFVAIHNRYPKAKIVDSPAKNSGSPDRSVGRFGLREGAIRGCTPLASYVSGLSDGPERRGERGAETERMASCLWVGARSRGRHRIR